MRSTGRRAVKTKPLPAPNWAKCQLCQSIIHSKHSRDVVTCSCGAITLGGGSSMPYCLAEDKNNVIFLDRIGNPKRSQ